jgi:hypothetical protein
MNIHDESPSSIPSLAGDFRSRFDATVINTKELQKLLNIDALPSFHRHRRGSPKMVVISPEMTRDYQTTKDTT